jgi:hypothetical protein
VILGGPLEAESHAPYQTFCIRPMQNLEKDKTGYMRAGFLKRCCLTCDVTPYDRFEGYDLCFFDEDGAAL